MKDRMDLSLSIAIGSSVQVELFVTSVLVLVSLVLGPRCHGPVFSKGACPHSSFVRVDNRSSRGGWAIRSAQGCSASGYLCRAGPDLFFMPGAISH